MQYPYAFDLGLMKQLLSEKQTDLEKLKFIQANLKLQERLIYLLENTKVATADGNGCWSIYTAEDELQILVADAVESDKIIFGRKITKKILDNILEGLKNGLKESYIYLKTEQKDIKRNIKSSMNHKEQNSIEKDKIENKNERDLIRAYLKKKGINREKLEELNQDSSLAKEICENVFPEIKDAVGKKAKIESLRVTINNMKTGRIKL